eukprot:COSAG04_NODE_1020_length_8729_cov_2.983082_3_plen_1985_part_00
MFSLCMTSSLLSFFSSLSLPSFYFSRFCCIRRARPLCLSSCVLSLLRLDPLFPIWLSYFDFFYILCFFYLSCFLCLSCFFGFFGSCYWSRFCCFSSPSPSRCCCAAGRYQAELDTYACSDCPAGTYGPAAGMFLQCVPCEAGTNPAADRTSCEDCIIGKFDSGTACEDCAAGTAASAAQQTECAVCAAGKFSAAGASAPGVDECADCPAGQFDDDNSAATDCVACATGQSSDPGASVESGGCSECSAGWEHPDGGTCTRCPAGKYDHDNITTTPCENCTAGSISASAGSLGCEGCPAGTFAAAGTAACVECPGGETDTDSDAATACDQCPEGQASSSSSGASGACVACGAGKFAPAGSAACIDCAAGRFDHDSLSRTDCEDCDAGQADLDSNAVTACIPCSAGTAAAAGQIACTMCAAGKYADAEAASCDACAAGQADHDLRASTACQQCPAGSIPGAGSTPGDSGRGCDECAAGKYAAAGHTTCADCAAGRVDHDNSAATACEACPSGLHSDPGTSGGCVACGDGWDENDAGVCTRCPVGTSDHDSDKDTDCEACTAGSISTSAGAYGAASDSDDGTGCQNCPAGKYAAADALSCVDCAAGKYVAVTATADASGCIDCVAGKYVATTGTAQASGCIDCLAGTYVDATGSDEASDCIVCAAGKHSAVTAASQASDCTDCAAGEYSAAGSDELSDCIDCDAGKYSTAAADEASCIACNAGSYSAAGSVADSDCIDCLLGSADTDSDPGTPCDECEVGQYAPGAGETCENCVAGQYDHDLTSTPGGAKTPCVACPAGKHAAGEGTAHRCFDCGTGTYTSDAIGAFVSTGAVACRACVAGQYDHDHGDGSPAAGSASTECEDCSAGQVSTEGQTACTACGPGQYATPGSAECEDCAVGKYDHDSLANTDCRDCAAGRSSIVGNDTCTDCDAGEYAAGGDACGDCPANTYDHDAPLRVVSVDASLNTITLAAMPLDAISAGNVVQLADAPGQTCGALPKGSDVTVSGVSESTLSLPLNAGDPAASTNCVVTREANSASTACQACPAGRQSDAKSTTCDELECSAPNGTLPAGYTATTSSGTTVSALGTIGCETPEYVEEEAGTPPTAVCQSDGSFTFAGCRLGACAPGTEVSDGSCTPCDAGRADLDSDADTPCSECLAGSYSNASSTSCTICAAGTHAAAGASECSPCAAGTSDDDYLPSTACVGCTIGRASKEAGAYGACDQCAAGKSAVAENATSCTDCPTDEYDHDDNATTACVDCPDGRFAEAGTSDSSGGCVPCGVGWEGGNESCSLCPPGKSDHDSNAATLCQPCGAGSYSESAGAFGNLDSANGCQSCAGGSYVAAGSTACIACLAGQADDDNSSSTGCVECAAGRSIAAAQTGSCIDCDAGQFAAAGSSACTNCTAGTNDHDSDPATPCQVCAAGKYSETQTNGSCIDCTVAQYAAENATSCTDCEAGQVDDDNDPATPCIACGLGEYLDTATVDIQSVDEVANSITVAAGHNIVVGQTLRLRTKASSSDACAMQPLAPTDLTVQSVAANVIQFRNDITDLGSQGSARCMLSATSCTACALGSADTDSDPATPCEVCDFGQFADSGTTACVDCAAGQYDHDLTDSYVDVVSIDAAADQVVADGLPTSEALAHVAAGHKLQLRNKPIDVAVASIDASANTITMSSVSHEIQAGETVQLQDASGQTCGAAPKGTDLSVTGVNGTELSFADLTAGDGSANTNCVVELACTAVPQPPTDFVVHTKAPEGNDTAITFSSPDIAGAGTATNCQLVLPSGSKSPCVSCPAGRYTSDLGTVYRCFQCVAGKTTVDADGVFSTSGAQACSNCAAGKYDHDSQAETECQGCSAGTASTEGETTCASCDAGKYAGAESSQCTDCAAGQFDNDSNSSTVCAACSAGRKSAAGQDSCALCPAGKEAGVGSTACTSCLLDTYDNDDDASTPCIACPLGKSSNGLMGLTCVCLPSHALILASSCALRPVRLLFL